MPESSIASSDVVIVGAGAAGLMTAITARRGHPPPSVLLLDGATKPGAKILVSGGSRCNVTNVSVSDRDFEGGLRTAIRRVLRAFPPKATIAFFGALGLTLHEEPGGKLFPDSNRSRDVLDALLREVRASGAVLAAGYRVLDVIPHGRRFRVLTSRGEVDAGAVVLATGGQALPKSGSDGHGFEMARRLGHTIVPTTPALVPLLLDPADPLHAELSGVSQEVELTVRVDGIVSVRLAGPLLWTHFGASGPVVLNASRHWLRARLEGRAVAMTVNFAEGRAFGDVDRQWTRLAAERPRSLLQTTLSSVLPASVAAALLRAAGLNGSLALAHLPRDERRRLAHALVEWPLPVTGSRGYTFAEATAGGVSLDDIDPSTMASRVCPGVYLVGEILDVDGHLGGFNFQWAWASGMVAGTALGLPAD